MVPRILNAGLPLGAIRAAVHGAADATTLSTGIVSYLKYL
jgi:hypothetical protein